MIPFLFLLTFAFALPAAFSRLHRPAKEPRGRWVEVQGRDRLWQAVAEGRAVYLLKR